MSEYYVVCRHTKCNPRSNHDKQLLKPVAVFDTLYAAQKATLLHDLEERTATKFTKYADWPLYTILAVERDWSLTAHKKPSVPPVKQPVETVLKYNPDPYVDPVYHEEPEKPKKASVLYDFITVAHELYDITKDTYDRYYAHQRTMVDSNNLAYSRAKTSGKVPREWGFTDPKVIGFAPIKNRVN